MYRARTERRRYPPSPAFRNPGSDGLTSLSSAHDPLLNVLSERLNKKTVLGGLTTITYCILRTLTAGGNLPLLGKPSSVALLAANLPCQLRAAVTALRV